ncbi:hypothetical protein [Kitasatospora sp. MAP5-34]|uniref:hypothetical protein n=1 Tax=Kitasatospora sp. MAP5-34 TaxID=3035102 RepID=UPI0024734C94|nr:hypothetical protein [Kitasatospora sp. MAP5-34]MDH6579190.1 hypothetical protein [Kitasatospora sp. MAP5-34]
MIPLADGTLPSVPGPLLGAAAMLLAILAVRRRRRRERLRHIARAEAWACLQRDLPALRAQGVHLAQVTRVYQRARTGSKAIVVWHDTGTAQDTWFEGRQVRPGAYLLLRGNTGYGPHNRNPKVFYVEPRGVVQELSG